MIIKDLPWDSDFFGKRIASVSVDLFEKETDIIAEITSYKSLYDLVYINTPGNYYFSDEILSNQNILFMDSKIIYQSVFENANPDLDKQISVYSSKKVNPDLLSLSLQSGAYSRYKKDKNFKKGDFEKLYTAWIENSINGSIADTVLVYKTEGKIAGMVSISTNKISEVAQIGLIAVDQSIQNKGIGSKLVDAVKTYAARQSIKTIEVATQLDNKRACAFYEKCYFSVKIMTNIYHYWPK